ncbi:MAG: response regulator [Luminiphilus sp.]|jgi:two-component system OmpR family response regulator
MRIILVEDDHSLATALEKALSTEGNTVDSVNTGEAALFLVENTDADAVILDLGLPDMDGLEVLARLKRIKRHLPVMLLTARDSLNDKVSGLDSGADDYLTKPFDMPELIARLRVMQRHNNGQSQDTLTHGEVVIDVRANSVLRDDQPVSVSSKEYTLLTTLMENRGRLLSREQLEAKIMGWGEQLTSNAIEVHIHNLRKKLGRDFIKTVRGIGYGVGL